MRDEGVGLLGDRVEVEGVFKTGDENVAEDAGFDVGDEGFCGGMKRQGFDVVGAEAVEEFVAVVTGEGDECVVGEVEESRHEESRWEERERL